MAGGKHILGKPKSHRIFGTARVGERGQIVIPKEARQFYDIRPGDTVLVLGSGESGLVLFSYMGGIDQLWCSSSQSFSASGRQQAA